MAFAPRIIAVEDILECERDLSRRFFADRTIVPYARLAEFGKEELLPLSIGGLHDKVANRLWPNDSERRVISVPLLSQGSFMA